MGLTLHFFLVLIRQDFNETIKPGATGYVSKIRKQKQIYNSNDVQSSEKFKFLKQFWG